MTNLRAVKYVIKNTNSVDSDKFKYGSISVSASKLKIHLPKYNSNSDFERRIANPHQWQIVHDGGAEQCAKCGCWDPTPVGMPAYSMAPTECEAKDSTE